MDKRLVLAVAGSGKSTHLVASVEAGKRALFLTYTLSNVQTLRNKVISRSGHLPKGTKIWSYFSFLYGFCYKPYFCSEFGTRGITFEENRNQYAKGVARYIRSDGYLYSNRLAKFIEEIDGFPFVIARLEKYFDYFLVDEVQDFSSHDLDFVRGLASAKLNIIYVGDFFQHTYPTSHDGKKGVASHSSRDKFISEFKNSGLLLDIETLKKSWRCPKSVCAFVVSKLAIPIETESELEGQIVLLEEETRISAVYDDNAIVKLFYQQSHKYPGNTRNWGECKGDDSYAAVCVVLNKTTWEHYEKDSLSKLAAQTRNKLYVALTRARTDVYLVCEERLKTRKASNI